MKSNKIAIIAILITILTISVAYASLSTTLNIHGTSNVNVSSWDIYFRNISPVTLSDTTLARENTTPALVSGSTSINNIDITFNGAATAFYTFEVVNDGSIDAKVSTVLKNNFTCTPVDVPTGEETAAATFATTACPNFNFEVTYADDTAINVDDVLLAGESANLKVTIGYNSSDPIEYKVQTSGLDIDIIYIQN